jgi:hypothetical protein
MTTQKLNADTINMLIGRTIKEASENWIQLDNGIRIYLDDSEIESLN